MPKISVVIPAYNAERTILETVESVLKQTFSDFEVIIIDDGSTDQTALLLQNIQDPRLKVFSYGNGGVSTARNRGIEKALGEYISLLDADDLWTSDKLESQLNALQQQPNAGVAYSWTCNMNSTGTLFYPGLSASHIGNVYPQLLVSNFIGSGSNCLIRRSALKSIEGFNSEFPPYADWDFYLRLAFNWSFIVVPKYQILYRQASGTMSSKVDLMEKYYFMVTEQAFKTAPPELQSLKQQSLARNYQYLSGICLANAKDREQARWAAYRLWKAIQSYPPILKERITQRYLVKLLLIQLLSPELAKRFTRPIGLASTMTDPRLSLDS